MNKKKKEDRLKRIMMYLTEGEWLVIINDLEREVEQDEQSLFDAIRESNIKDVKFFKDRILIKNKVIRRIKSKD